MTNHSATVHIRPDLAEGLEELAKATGRSASGLAEEPLAEFLDYQRWAGEHIREGLRQADAGELIPDEEVWARLDEKLARRLGERAERGSSGHRRRSAISMRCSTASFSITRRPPARCTGASGSRCTRWRSTRELVISGTPYLVPYRITDRQIQILAVIHGARRWPDRP